MSKPAQNIAASASASTERFEDIIERLIKTASIEAVAVQMGKSYGCIRRWRAGFPPRDRAAEEIAQTTGLPVRRVLRAIQVSRARRA